MEATVLETSPTAPEAPPPPAPLAGWRSTVRVAVGVLVTLVLLTAGVFGVLAIMRYSTYSVEYPARLTAPDRIGDLTRARRAELLTPERALVSRPGAFAAVYTAPGHRVFVTGRAERILVPDRALPPLPGPDAYRVDPGPVGGRVQCVLSGATVIVCAWADHGSAGVLRLAGWAPAEVPQVLADVRGATIVRG
jgi:hypothetical protein